MMGGTANGSEGRGEIWEHMVRGVQRVWVGSGEALWVVTRQDAAIITLRMLLALKYYQK